MAQGQDGTAVGRLLWLVGEYQAGRLDEGALRAALAADSGLGELVRREAGGAIERGGRVIAFGDQSQVGDVSIRDAAGRDIINLTINMPAQAGPPPVAGPEDPGAHARAMIAQHRTMLRALELQAAKFGLHTPAHITVEIAELKQKLAELQRELGGA